MNYYRFKLNSTGEEFIGWYFFNGPYTFARPKNCEHYGYDISLVTEIGQI